jgi:hypothetical protein
MAMLDRSPPDTKSRPFWKPAWDSLATPDLQPSAPFDPATLDALPEPAARWLRRALPDETPLVRAVEVAMHGEIRIGRWMSFTATQILRAGVGFVWQPTVGGRLVRFVGADVLSPDDARMEFRLHGRIPVARSSGPDTALSAAGRLAAETVAWIPQAATPQAGATWRSIDDRRAAVTVNAAGTDVEVVIAVADDGRLQSIHLDRWDNTQKPPAAQPFGGEIIAEHVGSGGVRVAGSGTIGWRHQTPDWPKGQFFRFDLDEIKPVLSGPLPWPDADQAPSIRGRSLRSQPHRRLRK